MSLKEVFTNAFYAYRNNFAKLFLPLLILQLVILLPLLFFTMPGTVNAARAFLVTLSSFSQTGTGTSSVFYVLIFIVLALLFFSPWVVSTVVFVIDKDYNNQSVSFREAFRFGKKRYGGMLTSYFSAILLALPIIFIVVLMLSHMFTVSFNPEYLGGLDLFLVIVSAILLLLFVLGTVFVPYIVVSEQKSGFSALFLSFKYVYQGNFLSTLSRLALAAALVGVLGFVINWLSQLPFKELFFLYLENPAAALQQPLMIFAIALSLIAIFLVALIIPFWYASSFNTYQGARIDYHKKYKAGEQSI